MTDLQGLSKEMRATYHGSKVDPNMALHEYLNAAVNYLPTPDIRLSRCLSNFELPTNF